MKQIVGILAHQADPQLRWLVLELIEQGYTPIIHADSKHRTAIKAVLSQHSEVVLDKSIAVRRGHVSLVQATLLLMEEACRSTFDYFHLISGEDLLIKNSDQTLKLLAEAKGKSMINFNALPVDSNTVNGDEGNDKIPLRNYRHFSLQNGTALYQSKHFGNHPLEQLSHKLFGKFRTYWRAYNRIFRRKPPDYQFYAGSAWFSISHDICTFVLQESKSNPALLRYMKGVLYPDELYFQTLLLNSEHRNELINSDLRYIRWEQNEQRPAYLEQKDIEVCKNSNGLFARKWKLRTEEQFIANQKQRLC